MSLFQQSSKTLAQAKAEVAASAGKDDDATMLTRAESSLRAAFRHLNQHRTYWDFTRTEHTDVTMDGAVTELADLPYNMRALYDARFVATGGNTTQLWPLNKRHEDRLNAIQPYGTFGEYDLFKSGGLGKIRVVNLSSTGTLKLKYYRRLNLPCYLTFAASGGTIATYVISCAAGAAAGAQIGASVTGTGVGTGAMVTAVAGTSITVSVVNSGTVSGTITVGATTDFLDIPVDYEDAPIGWATAHFLANNGGDPERRAYFQNLADTVIGNMIANNNFNEDEEISFLSLSDALGDSCL